MGFAGLLVVVLLLLVFFSSRLPDVMRSLGKSVNEFKKGMEESAEKPPEAPGGQAQNPPSTHEKGPDRRA